MAKAFGAKRQRRVQPAGDHRGRGRGRAEGSANDRVSAPPLDVAPERDPATTGPVILASTTGPLVMKSTSSPKNGFSRCSP
jgi:hypothetical protein